MRSISSDVNIGPNGTSDLMVLTSKLSSSGDICSPLNGVDRTCMHYQDCPQEIQDWVTMYPKPAHILKQLRDARCGETVFLSYSISHRKIDRYSYCISEYFVKVDITERCTI